MNEVRCGKRFCVPCSLRSASGPHANDVHFTFEDKAAVGLFLEVVKKIQPDVVVVGSDAFDLHLLTSFRKDPDLKVDTDIDGDPLASVEHHWNSFIHDLHAAAPKAKFVFIWGNHERRIVNKVLDDSPEWRKMIWHRFKTIIQCGGRVMWIGETDRVRIGPLLVQHGNRHGINAAKGHLNDLAYQVSTMFGHTHKLGIHSREGEDFYVESVNAGCLCELRPHYVRGTKLRQNAPEVDTWHGDCPG